jgi:hypothetical protein
MVCRVSIEAAVLQVRNFDAEANAYLQVKWTGNRNKYIDWFMFLFSTRGIFAVS